MSKRDWTLGLCAAFALSACTTLGTPADPAAAHAGSSAWESSTLYARDGTPLNTNANAQTPAAEPAARELQPSETGRMYILELYQKAIDERDGLRRELATLGADLEQARSQLTQGQQQQSDLAARVAQLEAANQQRVEENVDLAARLVTAQIRRLQVEKILLEQRLVQKHDPALAVEGAKTP
jgi:hypothetical protein